MHTTTATDTIPPGVTPGRWTIDGSASALWVSAAIGAYGTRVEVDTGSLSCGRPVLDRLLRVCGLVDTTANPWIRFASVALRPHQAGTGWWLDGTLSTPTGGRDVTLRLLTPVGLGPDRADFRALGELAPRLAGELLGVRPGLLHSPLGLALAVEAVRPMSPTSVPR